MNCDEFLDALESSDERRRTAAQWHANACPDCAALAEVHARLQKELGVPEPLPQRMRAVWAAAADDALQTRSTVERVQVRLASEAQQLRPLHFVAVAVALLFLVAIPLVFWNLNKEVAIQPEERVPTVPAVAIVKSIDASAELDKLLAQVNSLEAELSKTSKQADLVDVRREADILLATHSHW